MANDAQIKAEAARGKALLEVLPDLSAGVAPDTKRERYPECFRRSKVVANS